MTNTDIVAVVQRLVQAENARDAVAAAALLAADFTAITRARGAEQDRAGLLQELANPANPGLERRLEPDVWVRESAGLAVARSIVQVIDASTTPPAVTRFRNVHVLTRDAGAWKCLAWQVTKLA